MRSLDSGNGNTELAKLLAKLLRCQRITRMTGGVGHQRFHASPISQAELDLAGVPFGELAIEFSRVGDTHLATELCQDRFAQTSVSRKVVEGNSPVSKRDRKYV